LCKAVLDEHTTTTISGEKQTISHFVVVLRGSKRQTK
jgi:hypothetical protein